MGTQLKYENNCANHFGQISIFALVADMMWTKSGYLDLPGRLLGPLFGLEKKARKIMKAEKN